MGITSDTIINGFCNKTHQSLNLNVVNPNSCPCGKLIHECDCATCTQCSALFLPKHKQQDLCKKCLLIIMEAL